MNSLSSSWSKKCYLSNSYTLLQKASDAFLGDPCISPSHSELKRRCQGRMLIVNIVILRISDHSGHLVEDELHEALFIRIIYAADDDSGFVTRCRDLGLPDDLSAGL